MITDCIRSEDRKARKPRLQTLAAKFDQVIDMETMEGLIAAGWSKNGVDWIRREHGGWWQPWCIRASSGHSDFGLARPAELCNILFPSMSERLGGASHATKPSALEGIILRGIVPGGNDSARRLAAHCGVSAPWDSENISTKTAMRDVKEGDDKEIVRVPVRCYIARNDCCLPDHSLQRDKGNLEIQVHEERTCDGGQADLLPRSRERDLSWVQGCCGRDPGGLPWKPQQFPGR